MTDPIVKTIVVSASAARAFDIFVNRIGTWWPLDSHAVSASQGQSARDVVIEPRIGGAIYEVMFDGTRADWGQVLAIDPGQSVAFTWHPGTNSGSPTRVDVRFEDCGSGQVKVTLTHSGWDVWADEAPEKRGGYDTGWDFVLGECFAKAV